MSLEAIAAAQFAGREHFTGILCRLVCALERGYKQKDDLYMRHTHANS